MDGLTLFLRETQYNSYYTLQDMETYLVHPLKHGRARVFYDKEGPIGFVSWAFLSPEREKEFQEGLSLKEEDFENTEGSLWGVDFISTEGSARQMLSHLKKLKEKVYPSHRGKVRFLRFKTNNKLHEMRF